MDREQKAAAVAELTDRLKEAEAIFAVDYRGISVTQAAELRRRLTDAGASFKVVKNRLAKLAAADAGAGELDDLLVGPTALTLIDGDAVVVAKAISTFARENDVLAYKGGIMDGEPLDPEGFTAIARLPGREVLHGQLVGLAASPLTGLATGLGSMLSGLAIALGQIAEQGLVGGEAPSEEPTEPEAEEEQAEASEEAAEELAGQPESEAAAEAEEAAAEETSESSDEAESNGGDEQAPAEEPESEE
jgi:large subunit ribosomal protein L10